MMTWFKELTGFEERNADTVRAQLTIDGDLMRSAANGRVMRYGHLETPTLEALRSQTAGLQSQGKLLVKELVADVRALHADPGNAGAFFQVASQFNLLEMSGPSISPEHGVSIYEHDRTQGPACAIAAGAGTIYRNYFVPMAAQIGQSATQQLDCLRDLGLALGNHDQRLWRMQNGYALASAEGLRQINTQLEHANEQTLDQLRQQLRIGVQWQTEVTLADAAHIARPTALRATLGHLVTQAYCSALPVGYSSVPARLWEPFARLVLEASYEATLCAALLNQKATGNNRVYLTLLGGGVFGNPVGWIVDAIRRAIEKFRHHDLQISVVSYRNANPALQTLVDVNR
jgi:hypothetical protein